MTLGSVYLIVHYTGMLSRPIERISQEIERLQEAGTGVIIGLKGLRRALIVDLATFLYAAGTFAMTWLFPRIDYWQAFHYNGHRCWMP